MSSVKVRVPFRIAAIGMCLAVVLASIAIAFCLAPKAYAEDYIAAKVSETTISQPYVCMDADGAIWPAEPSGAMNKAKWPATNSFFDWQVKPAQFELVTTLFVSADVHEFNQVYFYWYRPDRSDYDDGVTDWRNIRDLFPNLQRVVFKTGVSGGSSVNEVGEKVLSGLTQLKEVSGFEKTQVNRIGNEAFKGCTSLTSITLPSALTLVGKGVFQGCSRLTSTVGLEKTKVTTLSESAFMDCRELKTASLPSTMVKVGMNAFASCINLTSVSLNSGLSTLGPGAFYNCELLPSVDLPASVNAIDYEAFEYCSKLTKVRVRAQTYPELGSNVFRYTPLTDDAYANTALIYVPDAKVSAYQAASGWKSYASRIVSEQYLNPINIAKASATVASAAYTGEAVLPHVTVTYGGKTLEEGVDYTYSYSNNVNAGTASVKVTGMRRFTGTLTKSFTIGKAANPLAASAKSKKLVYKRAKLRKSKKTVKNLNVSNAVGSVSYKNVSKTKAAKKFKVNAKNGKLVVPKKTKAGRYAVKIRVTAAGNANFKSKNKTVSFVIRVK